MVEFAFNSQENESSRHCHMEYLYGYKPPMPADLIIPAAGSDNVAASERAQRIMDIRLLVKPQLKPRALYVSYDMGWDVSARSRPIRLIIYRGPRPIRKPR